VCDNVFSPLVKTTSTSWYEKRILEFRGAEAQRLHRQYKRVSHSYAARISDTHAPSHSDTKILTKTDTSFINAEIHVTISFILSSKFTEPPLSQCTVFLFNGSITVLACLLLTT